jgi:hypothetical protein
MFLNVVFFYCFMNEALEVDGVEQVEIHGVRDYAEAKKHMKWLIWRWNMNTKGTVFWIPDDYPHVTIIPASIDHAATVVED